MFSQERPLSRSYYLLKDNQTTTEPPNRAALIQSCEGEPCLCS
jgi:hypothetical protein